jgi:hypothetical protein
MTEIDHQRRSVELFAEADRLETMVSGTDDAEIQETFRQMAHHWRELANLHLGLIEKLMKR